MSLLSSTARTTSTDSTAASTAARHHVLRGRDSKVPALRSSSRRSRPTRGAARAASGPCTTTTTTAAATSRRLVLAPLRLFLYIILDCKLTCCWHHDACGPGLLFVRAMSVDLGGEVCGWQNPVVFSAPEKFRTPLPGVTRQVVLDPISVFLQWDCESHCKKRSDPNQIAPDIQGSPAPSVLNIIPSH